MPKEKKIVNRSECITERHIYLAGLPKCAIITPPNKVHFPSWHILAGCQINIFPFSSHRFTFSVSCFGKYFNDEKTYSSITNALTAAYTWIKDDIGQRFNCSFADN